MIKEFSIDDINSIIDSTEVDDCLIKKDTTRQLLRDANLGKEAYNKGAKASDETREKQSNAAKNKLPMSEGTKEKLSMLAKGKEAHNKGTTASTETRGKMSATHKQRLSTPQARAEMSRRSLGTVKSPEAKAKMSAAASGRKMPDELRAHLSEVRSKFVYVTPTGEFTTWGKVLDAYKDQYTIHTLKKMIDNNLNGFSKIPK